MKQSSSGGAIAVIVCLALGVTSRPAFAEDSNFGWKRPKASYLWDGGAVPLLWLPLAATISLRLFDTPPSQPVMFSASEGGKTYSGGQFPTPLLYVNAVVAGGAILFGGDDSRWHHVKGFAQGVIMTQLLTTVAKNTFGRHRPMYDLAPGATNSNDQHMSFWSGHASSTLATATYLGLYARHHLFNRWRPAGSFTWWEGAAYAGLAAGALAIPYSQYALNRHHASDVITGSLVGIGVSTLSFLYQEHRYKQDKAHPKEIGHPEGFQFSIMPAWGEKMKGLTLSGTW
jgi:membrane-associated phospholipid phosphatase